MYVFVHTCVWRSTCSWCWSLPSTLIDCSSVFQAWWPASTQGFCLSLLLIPPLECWDYIHGPIAPGFYVGPRDADSGLKAFKEGPLSLEPFPTLKLRHFRGQRNDSEVKTVWGSSRGSRLSFQSFMLDSLQLPITLAPGSPTFSSGLLGHLCKYEKHTHGYISKNKFFCKKTFLLHKFSIVLNNATLI